MPKVIYLTGAPASGKSSTTHAISQIVPNTEIWEYGARLTDYVNRRMQLENTQVDIRRQSASIITPDDVRSVDKALLQFVDDRRRHANVIIDSHPVTREAYGFRVTAFSAAQVALLAPDEIWVLYTDPSVAVTRIKDDPQGRPLIDIEQARMHTLMQASVASTYGIITGSPVYFFDSASDHDTLVRMLAARLPHSDSTSSNRQ